MTLLVGCRHAAQTCRRFGISRQTFYRWKRRFDPRVLSFFRDLSHRPHQCRRPTWSPQLVEQVLRLRQQYPRWGKDKVVVLLRRRGCAASTSPSNPSYLRAARGLGRLHFAARDMVSRGDVRQVADRAAAATAREFRDARQFDGGSEFAAQFEQDGQARGLPRFVLPRGSPKLNGQCERAQRTHHEELQASAPTDWSWPQRKRQLRRGEISYNAVRPHQALDYRTPQQFIVQ